MLSSDQTYNVDNESSVLKEPSKACAGDQNQCMFRGPMTELQQWCPPISLFTLKTHLNMAEKGLHFFTFVGQT